MAGKKKNKLDFFNLKWNENETNLQMTLKYNYGSGENVAGGRPLISLQQLKNLDKLKKTHVFKD